MTVCRIYIATVVFLLFLVQQRVSRAMFEAFDVFPYRIRGESVLQSDVTVSTGSSECVWELCVAVYVAACDG